MEAESPDTAPASLLAGASLRPSLPAAVETAEFWEKWALASKLASATRGRLSPMPGNWRLGVRFFLVEPKSCFHAGAFGTRWSAIASICRRPASVDLGLAFRWPISRARRQMRGDRIKCLGLRTYRTSCINATDSICRRARMESQSVVKLGQWARVDDKSNRSRSACGNATCGTFQHFTIAPGAWDRERIDYTERQEVW